MGPDAHITVVVASRNRAALLRRLMVALARQEDVSQFEVVIVDDASTDGTPSMLSEEFPAGGARFRTIRLRERRGPAVARNLAWRSTTSPLVAFTDDDCVPTPGWLAAMVAGLTSADMVQGRTEPNPTQQHRLGPFSHTMAIPAASGFYETCNMGYRREVLVDLGGFDEDFRYPYGEDADLGWRARERGATFDFRDDAVVHHEVFASRVWDRVRTSTRLEGAVRVLSRHPQFRSSLAHRLFFRRSHPLAIVAAGGLALLAASQRNPGASMPMGAALVAPYLQHLLMREPLCDDIRTRVTSLPGALLLDLVQVGVLARASLRYRTLVL